MLWPERLLVDCQGAPEEWFGLGVRPIRSTTVVVLRSVAPQDGLDRPQRQARPGKGGYAALSKYLDEAENQTFGQRQETQKAPAANDGCRPGAP